MSLLDYLRDVEQITSLKNGCAEGACGACMVLVNGIAQRACILKLSKLEGKDIITVEGTALVETLEAVKDTFYNNKNVGIACAFKNAGLGVGIPDTGRCRIVVENVILY